MTYATAEQMEERFTSHNKGGSFLSDRSLLSVTVATFLAFWETQMLGCWDGGMASPLLLLFYL